MTAQCIREQRVSLLAWLETEKRLLTQRIEALEKQILEDREDE